MRKTKNDELLDLSNVDKHFWEVVKLENKYRKFFVKKGKRNASKTKHGIQL